MAKKFVQDDKLYLIIYDTLQDLFNVMKEPSISSRDNSSQTGSLDFTGTNSFEESTDLMINGDDDSYEMIVRMRKITDALFKYDKGLKQKHIKDVEGYMPNVPSAVKGLPNSMISVRTEYVAKKVIDVFYNSSMNAGNEADNLAYRGALLLSAIQTLEMRGYSVNLYIGEVCVNEGKYIGHAIKVKSSSDRLNAYKLAYYLVNPSYLRRTAFKISETEEDLPDCTHNGYGRAETNESMREALRKVFNSPDLKIFDKSVNININKSSEKNVEEIKKLLGGQM